MSKFDLVGAMFMFATIMYPVEADYSYIDL